MAYIYQGALYCDDCGRAITTELDKVEHGDPCFHDDSDTYPQYAPHGGGEADAPQHCDSGAACQNAITVRSHGKRYRIGAWLENDLTEDGARVRVRRGPGVLRTVSTVVADVLPHRDAVSAAGGEEGVAHAYVPVRTTVLSTEGGSMSDPFPLPPSGKRLYAHVYSFELVCPACGAFYRCGPSGKRAIRGAPGKGYSPSTGVFTCVAPTCRYRAYVGLVLWPLGGSHHPARPPDHVLTPGEAQRARYEASYASEGRLGGRRERVTNVECTCGQPCAVHTPPGPVKDVTPDWVSMRRKLQGRSLTTFAPSG